MSHDYHEKLPGFDPSQILHDGCGECEARSKGAGQHQRGRTAVADGVVGDAGADDAGAHGGVDRMTDLIQPQPLVEPLPNLPLLRKVLDHIDAHPEEWNQFSYGRRTDTACGTAFCIAGHAMMMSGYSFNGADFFDPDGAPIPPGDTELHGLRVLGLAADEGDRDDGLFAAGNKRDDVQRVAERIAARAGERL